MKKTNTLVLHLLILFVFFVTLSIVQVSCTKDKGKLPAPPTVPPKSLCDSLNVKFSADINPIIQSKCAIPSCHVSGGSGNGNFTTYAGVSAKADPPLGNGSLRSRCIDGNPSYMPPSGKLPSADLQKIDCWLKAGAPNN